MGKYTTHHSHAVRATGHGCDQARHRHFALESEAWQLKQALQSEQELDQAERALFTSRAALEKAKRSLNAPRYGWGVLLASFLGAAVLSGDVQARVDHEGDLAPQHSNTESTVLSFWRWLISFYEEVPDASVQVDENGGSADPETGE